MAGFVRGTTTTTTTRREQPPPSRRRHTTPSALWRATMRVVKSADQQEQQKQQQPEREVSSPNKNPGLLKRLFHAPQRKQTAVSTAKSFQPHPHPAVPKVVEHFSVLPDEEETTQTDCMTLGLSARSSSPTACCSGDSVPPSESFGMSTAASFSQDGAGAEDGSFQENASFSELDVAEIVRQESKSDPGVEPFLEPVLVIRTSSRKRSNQSSSGSRGLDGDDEVGSQKSEPADSKASEPELFPDFGPQFFTPLKSGRGAEIISAEAGTTPPNSAKRMSSSRPPIVATPEVMEQFFTPFATKLATSSSGTSTTTSHQLDESKLGQQPDTRKKQEDDKSPPALASDRQQQQQPQQPMGNSFAKGLGDPLDFIADELFPPRVDPRPITEIQVPVMDDGDQEITFSKIEFDGQSEVREKIFESLVEDEEEDDGLVHFSPPAAAIPTITSPSVIRRTVSAGGEKPQQPKTSTIVRALPPPPSSPFSRRVFLTRSSSAGGGFGRKMSSFAAAEQKKTNDSPQVDKSCRRPRVGRTTSPQSPGSTRQHIPSTAWAPYRRRKQQHQLQQQALEGNSPANATAGASPTTAASPRLEFWGEMNTSSEDEEEEEIIFDDRQLVPAAEPPIVAGAARPKVLLGAKAVRGGTTDHHPQQTPQQDEYFDLSLPTDHLHHYEPPLLPSDNHPHQPRPPLPNNGDNNHHYQHDDDDDDDEPELQQLQQHLHHHQHHFQQPILVAGQQVSPTDDDPSLQLPPSLLPDDDDDEDPSSLVVPPSLFPDDHHDPSNVVSPRDFAADDPSLLPLPEDSSQDDDDDPSHLPQQQKPQHDDCDDPSLLSPSLLTGRSIDDSLMDFGDDEELFVEQPLPNDTTAATNTNTTSENNKKDVRKKKIRKRRRRKKLPSMDLHSQSSTVDRETVISDGGTAAGETTSSPSSTILESLFSCGITLADLDSTCRTVGSGTTRHDQDSSVYTEDSEQFSGFLTDEYGRKLTNIELLRELRSEVLDTARALAKEGGTMAREGSNVVKKILQRKA